MSRLEDSLIPNPNTVYDENHTVIATLSSTTDTNQFLNKYNHDNKYNGLKLGQIISIYYNGSYTRWYIAGFDCEYNKIASDGTTYDNGYGIMLIPETYIGTVPFDLERMITGGYLNSYLNKSIAIETANNLKTVLGNHLINRQVLLSNSINSGYKSNSYQWTTAYATLPSVGQLTGTFAQNSNKYDDGEANYKLPLFDHMNYWTGYSFITRGIAEAGGLNYSDLLIFESRASNSSFTTTFISQNSQFRPLIYIR